MTKNLVKIIILIMILNVVIQFLIPENYLLKNQISIIFSIIVLCILLFVIYKER